MFQLAGLASLFLCCFAPYFFLIFSIIGFLLLLGSLSKNGHQQVEDCIVVVLSLEKRFVDFGRIKWLWLLAGVYVFVDFFFLYLVVLCLLS